MLTKSILTLTLPLLAAAYPSLVPRSNSTCAPLHIISARGSTEDPGEGHTLAAISTLIKAQIPGADSTGLDYPATLVDPEYFASESDGTKALTALLVSYAAQCAAAGSKIALLGYSQGAAAVMDTLCGTSQLLQPDTDPETNAAVIAMLSSVAVFGDPTHVRAQSYDRGNGTHDGLFARDNPAACAPFAPRLRSYCNAGDPFCDGGDDLAAHTDGAYPRAHGPDAVQWVVGSFHGTPPA